MKADARKHLERPVLEVARNDAATLGQGLTVREALDAIRERGVGEKIVYFYVVDYGNRLMGVLPTRRLLTADLNKRLSDVMVQRTVAIPATATILEACEAFVLHKFLALPVIDSERRVLGVVDVSLLTEEAFDLAEREGMDAVFEAIGVRVSQVREASPSLAFRFRFPWLLSTIASGTLCAVLASRFEMTLSKSIVLAFFLTLVLGLAESVSIQSMTVTIQTLRNVTPTFKWYRGLFIKEAFTALLLGLACGIVVATIVAVWRGPSMAAVTIGSSIAMALCAACFFGITVPSLLHALKLDPKIAAGPVTLAMTDLSTLVFYFTTAAVLL